MQPVIELPGRDQQMDFNRQRWAELSVDPVIAKLAFC